MEFSEIKKPIRKVKNNYFIIGARPLDPLVIIDGKHLLVDKITTKELIAPTSGSSLEIQNESISLTTAASKINFAGDGVTATESAPNEVLVDISAGSSNRLTLSEAFELDENNEITPVESDNISDTMWVLREGENLELRANLWRYNQGTAAVLVEDENGDLVMQKADDFPEDISF